MSFVDSFLRFLAEIFLPACVGCMISLSTFNNQNKFEQISLFLTIVYSALLLWFLFYTTLRSFKLSKERKIEDSLNV